MSTTPRISSAVPDAPPDFATVLAHQAELSAAFWRLYGEFWSHGALDQRTKEVARIRNARATNCGL
jgi:alkylhydroperoxidase/carboxymuconolactone decarboxylase family protein YurZ